MIEALTAWVSAYPVATATAGFAAASLPLLAVRGWKKPEPGRLAQVFASTADVKAARLLRGSAGHRYGTALSRLFWNDPALRWAEPAGFGNAEIGVLLGRYGRRVLIDTSDMHVLVVGPTRSRKSIGVIFPTLLDGWEGASALIHDPKGELWKHTAARRARYGHVLKFDPTDRSSVRFNPFDEVRPGETEVADVQNMVEILTEGIDAGHWTLAAQEYLVASVLHLLYAAQPEEKNLGGLRRHITTGDAGVKAMLATKAHPVAVRVATQMMSVGSGNGEREESQSGYRGSVYNSAGVLLRLYDDPVIDELTSRSEFTISDLMCADAPVSLYLIVRPSDAERVRRLIRLMVIQARRLLMNNEPADRFGRAKQHRCLFCLDEVLDLKMPDLAEALRSMASYGFKALIAAQSYADLRKVYGTTVEDNCALHVVYRPNSMGEARNLSDVFGKMRLKVQRPSKSYGPLSFFPQGRSVMEMDEERLALPPEEILRWPVGRWSVVLGAGKPIRADVINSYTDLRWARLLGVAPLGRRRPDLPYPDLPDPVRSPWLDIPPKSDPDPDPEPPSEPAPAPKPPAPTNPLAGLATNRPPIDDNTRLVI